MIRKLIVIMVCLLAVGIGCSKKSQYQFALDAVADKPEFDKGKKHWAMQYAESFDPTKVSAEDANRLDFLFGEFLGHPEKIDRPKEGEVVVCWGDTGKGVHLSIFNSVTQAERASLPLYRKECVSGLLGQ